MAKANAKGHVYFEKRFFDFLRDLKKHNEREWFLENKSRYESDVKEPMLAFIMAFADPLQRINKHFLADPRPMGGSMFRIFRDARFSKDKTPYKTHVGAQFRHQACSKDVHSPGFYLHLEPGGCFVSAGLWHPDPESLRKIRDRIVQQEKAWKAIKTGGLEVSGESLKRVPQGFSADHPFAEDLKLKDFYTGISVTEKEVCSAGFLEQFTETCRQNAPLMAFLTKALELPW